MKILYVASGIPLPGNLGGSTHAYEVARGLCQRGHEVHVIAVSREGHTNLGHLFAPTQQLLAGFTIYHVDIPKVLSLFTTFTVMALAHRLQPDVIMERYYNFAGAGMIAARFARRPTLLEVNALIVDPPSIRKRQIDDSLGGPMRHWATRQCHWADAIVTPLQTTIPNGIDRTRIHETPWGADVERFVPRPAQRPPGHQPTVVFVGSFRAWHGVAHGVQAARLLLERGIKARFLFVGHGPEFAQVSQLAGGHPDIVFAGAQPYAAMPAILASADIAIAPFDTHAHPALQAAGFFWSPLKIYEYMATALPVITSDISPLNQIVRQQHEGLLVPEADVPALATAIATLLADPQRAQQLGAAGRERVVAHYSWQRHCAVLEQIMYTITSQPPKPT